MKDLTIEDVRNLDFSRVGKVETAVDPTDFLPVAGFIYKNEFLRVKGPNFVAFMKAYRETIYNAKVCLHREFWHDIQERYGIPFPGKFEVVPHETLPDRLWIYYKSYLSGLPYGLVTETMFNIEEVYEDGDLVGFTTKFRRVE